MHAVADACIVTKMATAEEMDAAVSIWGNKTAGRRKGLVTKMSTARNARSLIKSRELPSGLQI